MWTCLIKGKERESACRYEHRKTRAADLCTDETLPAAQKRREVEELMRRALRGNVEAIKRVMLLTDGQIERMGQE